MKKYTLLILAIILASCSKKNISKIQTVESDFVMPELMSTVNMLFKIDKQAINDTFNIIVDKYLDTNMEMEASGFQVMLKKEEDATMEFLGRQVLSTLPIEIGVEKDGFLSNIKGSGKLELSFITDIDIDSSWVLNTKTELATHSWLEKPNLNVGGLKFNITSLADIVIDKSKESLEKQIDLSVSEQVQFKEKLLEMLKYVEKPILIDTLLNSWLHIQPQRVYMSNIENSSDFSIGNLTFHGKTKISSVKPKDVIPGIKLPLFNWEESLDDTSHMNMVLDISYDRINEFIKENYENETFKSGDKEITVSNFELSRQGQKLVVNTDVKGSLNGKLEISGIPVFDNDKQLFYTEDIDIKVKTSNVFKKAGAWLFKGKIKNQLQNVMRYSIKENIQEYQDLIDEQISQYSSTEQIKVKAKLNDINVNSFALDNDRIHAFITLNFYLETVVYNLSILNDPSLFNLKN